MSEVKPREVDELPEFNEPTELQEWYDIGADIRIKIRIQFSQLRRQSQALLKEKDAEIERLKSFLSKDALLEIVEEWQMYWMHQKINPEDTANYYRRAFGVDANMRHSLARLISKKSLGVQNGLD